MERKLLVKAEQSCLRVEEKGWGKVFYGGWVQFCLVISISTRKCLKKCTTAPSGTVKSSKIVTVAKLPLLRGLCIAFKNEKLVYF